MENDFKDLLKILTFSGTGFLYDFSSKLNKSNDEIYDKITEEFIKEAKYTNNIDELLFGDLYVRQFSKQYNQIIEYYQRNRSVGMPMIESARIALINKTSVKNVQSIQDKVESSSNLFTVIQTFISALNITSSSINGLLSKFDLNKLGVGEAKNQILLNTVNATNKPIFFDKDIIQFIIQFCNFIETRSIGDLWDIILVLNKNNKQTKIEIFANKIVVLNLPSITAKIISIFKEDKASIENINPLIQSFLISKKIQNNILLKLSLKNKEIKEKNINEPDQFNQIFDILLDGLIEDLFINLVPVYKNNDKKLEVSNSIKLVLSENNPEKTNLIIGFINRLYETDVYKENTTVVNNATEKSSVIQNLVGFIEEFKSHEPYVIEDRIYEYIFRVYLPNIANAKFNEQRSYITYLKLMKAYYTNIHPVIWINIFVEVMNALVSNPPYDFNSIIKFISQNILLNSGPFILKFLQLLHPFLTFEQRDTLGLRKLAYPNMTEIQIDNMLSVIIPKYHKFVRIGSPIAASVGQVVILECLDDNYMKKHNIPKRMIVKIIKIKSMLQCLLEKQMMEQSNLVPLYKQYALNIIGSNKDEFNTLNEQANIDAGKLYVTNYYDIFKIDANVHLDVISNVALIDKSVWYAFAMSVAPGVSLADLYANEKYSDYLHDSNFMYLLHRGFDLLVYKFYDVLMRNNFCHGDLHAGNIFVDYVYPDYLKLTLIDFGAVEYRKIFNDEYTKLVSDLFSKLSVSNYTSLLLTIIKLAKQIQETNKSDDNIKIIEELDFMYKKCEKYITDFENNTEPEPENKGNYDFDSIKQLIKKLHGYTHDASVVEQYSVPEKIKTFIKLNKLPKSTDKPDMQQSLVFHINSEYKYLLNDILGNQTTQLPHIKIILATINDVFNKFEFDLPIVLDQFFRLLKAINLVEGVLEQFKYSIGRTSALQSMLSHDLKGLSVALSKDPHESTLKNLALTYERIQGLLYIMSAQDVEFFNYLKRLYKKLNVDNLDLDDKVDKLIKNGKYEGTPVSINNFTEDCTKLIQEAKSQTTLKTQIAGYKKKYRLHE
jgi:hypothetical protein